MALFKIFKGNAAGLPTAKTEGYMYITQDQGDIYVDISSSSRKQLNANYANKLRDTTDTSKLLDKGDHGQAVYFSGGVPTLCREHVDLETNQTIGGVKTFSSPITLGSTGTAGGINLYANGYKVNIVGGSLSANRTLTLPNATGTVALTSHKHTTSASWDNRTLSITAGGSAAVTATIPATLTGFDSIAASVFKGELEGNADTTTKLFTARTIDGVSFDGSAAITHYGTCSTAAGTAAKEVSLTGFTLVTGAKISVKFSATNNASNPTLNVNSTGAKAIYFKNAAISASYLKANYIYEFIYDGTNYVLVGDVDTNTNTQVRLYKDETGTYPIIGSRTAAGSVTSGSTAVYGEISGTNAITMTPSTGTITATAFSGSGASLTSLNASNVTSGILTVARGGTGVTTNPSMLTNLGSTTAASVFAASPRPGVTGTLPITNGGTGATTAAGVLTNLGITATAAELNYVDGVTSNIQTQLNSKVKKSGDTMSGALQISKTAADKTSPTGQDLVINYSLPSGGTLTEKNAPGIGFHIGNVSWANFIYDGTFKFVNNNFTGYAPVQASKFIGALQGNADTATALTSKSIGSATNPVYFDANGKPVATTYTLGKSVPSNAVFTDKNVTHSRTTTSSFRPIILHSLYSTYGTDVGSATDQLYYNEVFAAQPSTGTIRATKFQGALVGNADTATKLANAKTITLSGSVTGSASFDGSDNVTIATTTNHTHSYLPLAGGSMTGNINRTTYKGGSWVSGRDNAAIRTSSSVSTSSFAPIVSAKTQLGSWDLGPCHPNENFYFSYATDANYTAGTNTTNSVVHIRNTGVLMGAAWNDYAEYRTQFKEIEPGYCVASADNGQVYKTTKKFQACDGIVSDTFGFAIGETDECKTPLAVAGRVLAYYAGNREDYHAGDVVCAGPEGRVMKMTREEIREYPDRIIGHVSEIPSYDTWGTGNIAVNDRIWIKVR